MMVCWLQTEPIQPQSWKVTWLNQSFSCVCFGRMTRRSHLLELQGPMNRSRNFCRVFEAKFGFEERSKFMGSFDVVAYVPYSKVV